MDGVEDRDAQCDFEGKKGTMAELKILHSNLMAYTAMQPSLMPCRMRSVRWAPWFCPT